MRLHRFIGNFDLSSEEIKITDTELRNQIIKVLRLRAGSEIELSDGHLNEARVMIADIGKDMRLNVLERWQNKNEPDRHIILYCAILKKENFELVVQKATEAGVKEIVPLVTTRTVKLDIRKDRLEKIIREAAEQSGRGIVPVLHESVNLDEVMAIAKNNDSNMFFEGSGESFTSVDRLGNKVGIWVGPEGGWDSHELDLAQKSDFKIINLGKLTLRAETAAIVGTYLVVHNI